jgi:hypothetical protein
LVASKTPLAVSKPTPTRPSATDISGLLFQAQGPGDLFRSCAEASASRLGGSAGVTLCGAAAA